MDDNLHFVQQLYEISQNHVPLVLDSQHKADLLQFFANNPNFEFGRSDVRIYLQENAETAMSGVSDPEGLKNQLLALQRVHRVVPRDETLSTLMNAGLYSANDIVSNGEMAFVEKFSERLGESWAKEIFQKAVQILADGEDGQTDDKE